MTNVLSSMSTSYMITSSSWLVSYIPHYAIALLPSAPRLSAESTCTALQQATVVGCLLRVNISLHAHSWATMAQARSASVVKTLTERQSHLLFPSRTAHQLPCKEDMHEDMHLRMQWRSCLFRDGWGPLPLK